MDAVIFILFGMVAGMLLLPHLQWLVVQARRRLAELDQLEPIKGPGPASEPPTGGHPPAETR
jgi:hypothetical protein